MPHDNISIYTQSQSGVHSKKHCISQDNLFRTAHAYESGAFSLSKDTSHAVFRMRQGIEPHGLSSSHSVSSIRILHRLQYAHFNWKDFPVLLK